MSNKNERESHPTSHRGKRRAGIKSNAPESRRTRWNPFRPRKNENGRVGEPSNASKSGRTGSISFDRVRMTTNAFDLISTASEWRRARSNPFRWIQKDSDALESILMDRKRFSARPERFPGARNRPRHVESFPDGMGRIRAGSKASRRIGFVRAVEREKRRGRSAARPLAREATSWCQEKRSGRPPQVPPVAGASRPGSGRGTAAGRTRSASRCPSRSAGALRCG
jgi:hypothetical protein